MRTWLIVLALTGCGDNGKPYGAPCARNDDCASGTCGGPNSISRTCGCATDSDCPAGEVCRMSIDIGRRCGPGPSDAGVDGH